MKFETLVLILPLALSISTSVHGENGVHRRILHQPLFPVSSFPPSPPDSSGGDHSEQPFFPEDPNNETQNTTPVAPPSPTTNGSLPISTATHPSKPTKRAAIAISIGIVALGILSALLFFFYRNKAKNSVEEQKLEEVNPQSQRNEDGSRAPPPSSFLYIGTVDPQNRISAPMKDHKLSPMKKQDRYRPSPDLMPLPALKKATASSSEDEGVLSWRNSKRNSPGSQLPASSNSSPDVIKHAIIPSIKTTPPRQEAPSLKPLPPERKNGYVSEVKLSLPRRAKFGPPPPPPNLEIFQSISDKSHLEQKVSATTSQQPLPPPPFLPSLPARSETVPPKVRSTWTNFIKKPSESDSDSQIHTAASLRLEVDSGGGSSGKCDGDDVEDTKPKLKPLHWHKVRASSERATVWDQVKPSSFKLNEDRMESLFGSNSNKLDTNGTSRRSVVPPAGTENRVLDPKKLQNIAILLRALNVTRDEVSEALLDGNSETLGAELLETLVKMAPTKEEEIKLTGYKGDTSKLGSAEKFLKAVLDIPFAFKRVEAMLYMANFDAEVQYLRKSFRTLEEASIELKSSRLFLKLLEAVLTTGNRMNVGTNRGGAKSFKLDTLLKLVDIKGTDGKTTLLHFVVQEIIKSEDVGSVTVTSELGTPTNSKGKEEEFRRQGLIIVAGLSREIGTVKLAAGMDSDVLRSNISKLETGLQKVRTVLQYEKSDLQGKFFESIKAFHSKAEEEICKIKENERKALTLVREVTEYFHGDVGKEEAHPLRIFMTVKDFLSSLDHVCKDVGTMQDRPMMGAARSFRISAKIPLPVLSRYNVRQDDSSSEESSSPWNN